MTQMSIDQENLILGIEGCAETLAREAEYFAEMAKQPPAQGRCSAVCILDYRLHLVL